MAKTLYCWRCGMDIPMLDEDDWKEMYPALSRISISDDKTKQLALDFYFELTGFRETNINAIWHHIVDLYGPPCCECGKPLRTPRAKWCAACGATAEAPDL